MRNGDQGLDRKSASALSENTGRRKNRSTRRKIGGKPGTRKPTDEIGASRPSRIKKRSVNNQNAQIW
jgi:hypothetical protein